MFQSFYNGLSGMFSSSKALDILSDNVSNMQTPGYKAKDSFATNLSASGKGIGTSISDVTENFTQGEVSRTGNSTDLFIDGRALFVLKDGNDYVYTRAGALVFNEDNVLVDKLSGLEVVGIDENNQLTTLSLEGLKSIPFVKTSIISIKGELTTADSRIGLKDIEYVDTSGKPQKLDVVVFHEDDTWKVEVSNPQGTKVGEGTIEFDLAGTLKPGKEKITVTLPGGQLVDISFGEAGSLSGTRLSIAGVTSSIQLGETDGHQDIPFKEISIDDKGVVKLEYTNDEKKEVGAIGFVAVDNYDNFKVKKGHLLSAKKSTPEIHKIGQGVEATITSGSLELSNVDLAQEFGDMMVIQRSYQASSRVMTISNQLIEQLYNSTGR
ncbi:TPA: flagellar hook protein FlgE [Vibrio vulnificus]|nr:flagellar hook protein FlgE [Vibrio vulnificus]